MSVFRQGARFLSNYLLYASGIDLTALVLQWLAGFLDEILKSKVSQVSVVLAVIGITGALSAGLNYAATHPAVALISLACGLLLVVGLTMYDFAIKQRMTINASGATSTALEAILACLVSEQTLTKSELTARLGQAHTGLTEGLDFGLEEGWIEYASGALRIPEAMRPIVRRRLRTYRRNGSDS